MFKSEIHAEKLTIFKKGIFILILVSIFFILFRAINEIALQIIYLYKIKHSTLDIIKDIFLTISTAAVASFGVALIGLYFSISNYLRKHGNEVHATLGVEFNEKILILVNKKDKPLIFNTISLLLEKNKYLVLTQKDRNKIETSSDYEIIAPYSILTIKLQDSPLLNSLFLSNTVMQVTLSTYEGLIMCGELKIVPLQIRALRDPKNFILLNPDDRVDN